MYFWNIEKLKTEMAERPLTDREVLPYVVISMTLFAAVTSISPFMQLPGPNVWDVLQALWSIALALGGTIYIYWKNGSAEGSFFLQRYFAVGWVVGVRWAVILIVPMLFVFILAGYSSDDSTPWYEFLILVIIETVVWERTGHHVGDLARRAAGPEINASENTEKETASMPSQ